MAQRISEGLSERIADGARICENLHTILSQRRPDKVRVAGVQSLRRKSREFVALTKQTLRLLFSSNLRNFSIVSSNCFFPHRGILRERLKIKIRQIKAKKSMFSSFVKKLESQEMSLKENWKKLPRCC